ncbi:MAG TPA: MaoC family dehydratase N-terminal domain-containing protein [Paraburkholderia sp.]|jgi:acyl dehydratase
MIDRSHIGYATQPTTVKAEPWRVKLFCQAIGETDSVYWDADAARVRGLPGCPLPPTFLKSLESEHCGSAELLGVLGVPVRRVLHAEQSFEYLLPVYAGDEVEVSRKVVDIYDKRNGAMTFVVVETVYCVGGECVGRSVQNLLVRAESSA